MDSFVQNAVRWNQVHLHEQVSKHRKPAAWIDEEVADEDRMACLEYQSG